MGSSAAVAALLSFTQPQRGFLRWKHPPKDPVYLAALRALRSWSDDRSVRTVLDLAQRRRDPEIAAAVTQENDTDG